jgi:hypothetical protein
MIGRERGMVFHDNRGMTFRAELAGISILGVDTGAVDPRSSQRVFAPGHRTFARIFPLIW